MGTLEPTQKVLHYLAHHAYQRRRPSEPPFLLASGETSKEYLDCRLALSHGACLVALGRLVAAALRPEVQAVGGLTLGADPVAISAAASSASAGRGLKWFTVRKEAKGYGQGKRLEGDVRAGTVVCVVDDVVTTGGSTIRAIACCREAELRVAQVLVLVDRQERGGMDAIRQAVGQTVPVTALFRKAQVVEAWASGSPG